MLLDLNCTEARVNVIAQSAFVNNMLPANLPVVKDFLKHRKHPNTQYKISLEMPNVKSPQPLKPNTRSRFNAAPKGE
ncbi:MAG: hypothetical protein WBG71_02120 [Leeuwenhoekiella sp.]